MPCRCSGGRTLWLAAGAEPIAAYMLSWTRADALLIGAALAMLRSDARVWPKLVRAAPLLAAAALGASIAVPEGLRFRLYRAVVRRAPCALCGER